MASLCPKKAGGTTYWYLREMGRVDGKPKMISERYLGSAADIAAAMPERGPGRPAVRDQQARLAEPLETGLPLGLAHLAADQRKDHTAPSGPGARMLFYTGGISKARDKPDSFYPMDRCSALLGGAAPDAALDRFYDDALRHAGYHLQDDSAALSSCTSSLATLVLPRPARAAAVGEDPFIYRTDRGSRGRLPGASKAFAGQHGVPARRPGAGLRGRGRRDPGHRPGRDPVSAARARCRPPRTAITGPAGPGALTAAPRPGPAAPRPRTPARGRTPAGGCRAVAAGPRRTPR